MSKVIKGKPIVPGKAKGQAVVSHQPISFWGGVDPMTGEVIDRRHECSGTVITGKVFVFPTGKGSSTGSAVLMESIRNGSAPAAIINCKTDPILALGAIVAEELYHKTLPMVVVSQEDIESIQNGDNLIVQPDGTILVNPLE
jgi:predicted aconitase with swiveling domain